MVDRRPTEFNAKLVRKKWKDETSGYLNDLAQVLEGIGEWTSENVGR